MSVNRLMSKVNHLQQWFQTPQGRQVAQAFASDLSELQDVLNGSVLLQLGDFAENLWLDELRYRNKWLVAPLATAKTVHVAASFEALPFERNSVDCILAPMTMQIVPHGGVLINEMDRVLKSTGHIIFLGVNPWSIWGVCHKLKLSACFRQEALHLRSAFSIKHLLSSLDYVQCAHKTFYYIPPTKHPTLLQKLEFLNEMGKMFYPFPAGFYCLVMQKHQQNPIFLNDLAVNRRLGTSMCP